MSPPISGTLLSPSLSPSPLSRRPPRNLKLLAVSSRVARASPSRPVKAEASTSPSTRISLPFLMYCAAISASLRQQVIFYQVVFSWVSPLRRSSGG